MITISHLYKTFTNGTIETPVLKGVDLVIRDGEFVAIMGKSGAGKSTLLYHMGLLDRPTSGTISIDDTNVVDLDEYERTRFRLNYLGYVFQDYALVPELTAQENVMMPLLMLGLSQGEAYAESARVLERIGLGHRLNNLPSQLSGGEQQRVSIARAIVQKPKILFADEPTANLDTASSQDVLDLFSELHKNAGQTIVMVTHELEYTKACDRIIFMEDGKIVREKVQKGK